MPSDSFTENNTKPRSQFLQKWGETLIILGLLAAAILLYTVDLGSVPLRDWDEGIVAQVAREISQGDLNWLYPQIQGTPYLNKPPLVHWLISLVYAMGGVNEWTARLVPAVLTATSVPLLYVTGKELFHQRTASVLSALVYLTLLPMVRHGRLAMLDGVVICFFLLMAVSVLRSRRDLRYTLMMGISFGCLCLTKGILLGLLLGAILIGFLIWDTPRLLRSSFFWGGLLLGSAPMILWYAAQWFHYGQDFIQANLVHQSLQRIWEPVGDHAGPFWYYLLELLELSWPWLFFFPQGLGLTWENRNLSQGKLLLIWMGMYGITISLMNTKLPWYILPLYPAIALVIGYQLSQILKESPIDFGQIFPGIHIQNRSPKPSLIEPEKKIHLQSVAMLLIFLGIVAGSVCIISFIPHFSLFNLNKILDFHLKLTLAAVATTLTLSGILLKGRDQQFILILIWGLYLSLLLFMTSDYWVWELGEDYPVKPVAAMVKSYTPPHQKVYTSHPFPRPSLNFYSDHPVEVADPEELREEWEDDSTPYFLLDAEAMSALNLDQIKVLAITDGWYLVTRDPDGKPGKLGIQKTDRTVNQNSHS